MASLWEQTAPSCVAQEEFRQFWNGLDDGSEVPSRETIRSKKAPWLDAQLPHGVINGINQTALALPCIAPSGVPIVPPMSRLGRWEGGEDGIIFLEEEGVKAKNSSLYNDEASSVSSSSPRETSWQSKQPLRQPRMTFGDGGRNGVTAGDKSLYLSEPFNDEAARRAVRWRMPNKRNSAKDHRSSFHYKSHGKVELASGSNRRIHAEPDGRLRSTAQDDTENSGAPSKRGAAKVTGGPRRLVRNNGVSTKVPQRPPMTFGGGGRNGITTSGKSIYHDSPIDLLLSSEPFDDEAARRASRWRMPHKRNSAKDYRESFHYKSHPTVEVTCGSNRRLHIEPDQRLQPKAPRVKITGPSSRKRKGGKRSPYLRIHRARVVPALGTRHRPSAAA